MKLRRGLIKNSGLVCSDPGSLRDALSVPSFNALQPPGGITHSYINHPQGWLRVTDEPLLAAEPQEGVDV